MSYHSKKHCALSRSLCGENEPDWSLNMASNLLQNLLLIRVKVSYSSKYRVQITSLYHEQYSWYKYNFLFGAKGNTYTINTEHLVHRMNSGVEVIKKYFTLPFRTQPLLWKHQKPFHNSQI